MYLSRSINRVVHVSILLCLTLSGANACANDQSDVSDQVRVIFKKRCLTCHSESRARGDLDMSSFDSILAGSMSGSVVVPGKPDESLLYLLASHQDNPKMPPNAPKMPTSELNVISRWIAGLKPEKGETTKETAERGREPTAMTIVNEVVADRGLRKPRAMPAKGAVTALALSPSASLGAVSGLYQVLLLNLETQEWIGGLDFPEGDVLALAFSPDGGSLYAAGGQGGGKGAVVVWDMNTHHRTKKIETESVVLAMDVSSDGKLIAIGGPNRLVEIYDSHSGKAINVFKKHTDWVTSVAFSPDGLLLATGDRFGGIHVWEIPTGLEFGSFRGHTGLISEFAWTEDSNRLGSAGRDGSVQLWNMETGDRIASWQAHQNGVESLVENKGLWISIGRDETLSIWSKENSLVRSEKLNRLPTQLAVSPERKRVIVGDVEGDIHLLPLAAESSSQRVSLPFQPISVTASVLRPKPIDRSLRESKIEAPKSELDRVGPDLAEARLALEDAQASLLQVQQTEQKLRMTVERLKRWIANQESPTSPLGTRKP